LGGGGPGVRELEPRDCVSVAGGLFQGHECHTQKLAIAKEMRDRAEEGGAYGNLSNAYGSQGDFSNSIEHHTQRLAIAQEVGDRAGEGGDSEYGNLGIAYTPQGNFSKAIEHRVAHAAPGGGGQSAAAPPTRHRRPCTHACLVSRAVSKQAPPPRLHLTCSWQMSAAQGMLCFKVGDGFDSCLGSCLAAQHALAAAANLSKARANPPKSGLIRVRMLEPAPPAWGLATCALTSQTRRLF